MWQSDPDAVYWGIFIYFYCFILFVSLHCWNCTGLIFLFYEKNALFLCTFPNWRSIINEACTFLILYKLKHFVHCFSPTTVSEELQAPLHQAHWQIPVLMVLILGKNTKHWENHGHVLIIYLSGSVAGTHTKICVESGEQWRCAIKKQAEQRNNKLCLQS